ncbi:MAG: hypothetical protein QOH66_2568, partial [Actinomycetota bacterium]|nr:hypothetical protein [Actinomycetota bacterium]
TLDEAVQGRVPRPRLSATRASFESQESGIMAASLPQLAGLAGNIGCAATSAKATN